MTQHTASTTKKQHKLVSFRRIPTWPIRYTLYVICVRSDIMLCFSIY